MRTFKTADVGIQLIAIIFGVTIGILNRNYFVYPYFVVAGWQLFSCLIHGFFQEHFYPVKGRKFYLITLAIVFLWVIMGFAGEYFFFLYFLLFFYPFMALWYCYICYKEVKLYQQKEWIQLK